MSLGEPSHTDPIEENEGETVEETGVAVQRELTILSLEKMKEELERNKCVIEDLHTLVSVHKATFSEEYLANDDIVRFYTGLPNLKVLKAVFDLVKSCVPMNDPAKLTRFQEFIATIAKLRLNCPSSTRSSYSP